MEPKSLIAQLVDINPDAVLFDNMDCAVVGIGYVGEADPVAVYSRAKIFAKLRADGLSEEDAEEYYDSKFICLRANVNVPVILDDMTNAGYKE
jgi:hypothetical protein